MARKVKYHINPTTMQPNVCKAKPGNCPYGNSPHYDTFDEAQRAAQSTLAASYETLPAHDSLDDYSDWTARFYEWDKLSDTTEIEDMLRTTTDGDLVYSMLNRMSSLSDNPKYMDALLENPNLPEYFLERVSAGPEYYNEETLIKVAKSPAMNDEHLMTLFMNAQHEKVRFEVCKNGNLSDESAMIIYNGSIENLHYRPVSGLLYNPSFPEDIRNEYYKELLSGAFFTNGKYGKRDEG